jgi:hypothetical protein
MRPGLYSYRKPADNFDRILKASVRLFRQLKYQVGLSSQQVGLSTGIIIEGGFVDGHKLAHCIDMVARRRIMPVRF